MIHIYIYIYKIHIINIYIYIYYIYIYQKLELQHEPSNMLWVEQTGNMVEDCLVNSLLVGNIDPFTHSLYLCLVHASAPAHHFDTTLLQECDLTTRLSQFVTTHLHTALPT